jgi:2-haloacid dehalogenase
VPVRAVVFDIGGVLFDWNLRYLYAKLIPDPARLDWFVSHVVTTDWHFQHDAGRDFADTSAELIACFPGEAELIRAFFPRFRETIGAPMPGMLELVAELDEAGVPLFAITNFSHEFFPAFRAEKAALFGQFRDIVVSGNEKLAKPDPAIYALALERFGLGAGEAVFIDDTLANVMAANRCGLIGHHFDGVIGTRTWLDAFGLNL